MRKFQLLATTFGAALLVAAPAALAQQAGHDYGRTGGAGSGYGYTPPPGTPLTPDTQGRTGLIPPVGQQYSAARRAEDTTDDVSTLLRQADSAMSRGRFGLANEYLERAETALLNREAISGGMPTQGSELQRQIVEARQALMNRDRATAQQHVRVATDLASRGDASMATGAGTTGMAPMQGGGGAAVGTQYNPTAVPPYGGTSGTRTMPSAQMPGTSSTQAAGVPNVPPTGVGAPAPGQPFPDRAGSGPIQPSTGGQIQPGIATPGLGSSGGGPGGGAGGGGAGGSR